MLWGRSQLPYWRRGSLLVFVRIASGSSLQLQTATVVPHSAIAATTEIWPARSRRVDADPAFIYVCRDVMKADVHNIANSHLRHHPAQHGGHRNSFFRSYVNQTLEVYVMNMTDVDYNIMWMVRRFPHGKIWRIEFLYAEWHLWEEHVPFLHGFLGHGVWASFWAGTKITDNVILFCTTEGQSNSFAKYRANIWTHNNRSSALRKRHETRGEVV